MDKRLHRVFEAGESLGESTVGNIIKLLGSGVKLVWFLVLVAGVAIGAFFVGSFFKRRDYDNLSHIDDPAGRRKSL